MIRMRVLVLRGCALSLLFGLLGCMPTVTYGTPPKTDRLGSLEPGVSTTAVVRERLGEPRGYGAVRLGPSVPLRTIWFYEYEQGEGARVNLKFLLVYFYQDQYEGYDWFSSASLLQQK